MSARGARSRKVQQKEVEKKEKKAVGKGKAPALVDESRDAFAEWSPAPNSSALSRSLTISSNNSRATSRSSSTHDSRPRLNTLPSDVSSESRRGPKAGSAASVSDVSSKGKEKTKYQAKGKETKAPRGRGGGVPIKKAVGSSPLFPSFRSESSASDTLPAQKTWLNFKIWEGGKSEMRPYGGFSLDQDMQNGSVLIYFQEEQGRADHPIPSIRADLAVLQNSGSTWLSNALLYGQIDDHDVDDWALSEASTSPIHQTSLFYSHSQPSQRKMLGPTSPGGSSPPPFDIDQRFSGLDSRAASIAHHYESTRTVRSDSPSAFRHSIQCNPTHEIWFTAPNDVRNPQEQRLHHVAVRNFLALLHGKPIVGADLFDMLKTLQPQIQDMYDLDSDTRSIITPRERSIQMITHYLDQHGLDDIRNNIRRALALLAWAELDNIRWREAYLESFVHLAGVMTKEVEDHPDFKRLSVATRRNLGHAGKTLQLRVMEAEEKLATFDFEDLWEDTMKVANSPVYQSYQAFREFLVGHFTRLYGNWPPSTNKTWLNRRVANALQEDFGSLYDYFVDRDVVWNPREERASRKWEMAHRKDDTFRADLPELGMTDMLVTYDAKHGYSHIPHPYPLLPKNVAKEKKEKEKRSLFSALKKDKAKDATKDVKASLQLSIVFSDATNIEKLDVNFKGSTLIDKFEQFELTTDTKQMTPREARLGRWVLLYGILQVLSTLAVDVQGLKHTDGVRYFLCTDLKRMPDWVNDGQMEHLEATQQRSWCWQRQWDPKIAQTAPVELDAAPNLARRNHNTRPTESQGNMQASGYPLPSPPPTQALPPPPIPHGTALMQSDIRRIGEKIDNLTLSHNAPIQTRQEHDGSRRGETTKPSLYDFDFSDKKPRLQGETFGSRIPDYDRSFSPRSDSLPHYAPDFQGGDFISRQQHALVPPPSLNLNPKSTVRNSVDTDLGAYPFSTGERDWPVPPGYGEKERGRRESSVLGMGMGMEGEFEGRAEREKDMNVGIRRTPRGTHESRRA